MTLYYLTFLIISLMCSAVYLIQWKKNYSIYYTLVFLLIPMSNIGPLMSSVSKTIGELIISTKITYLGGCFLLMIIMFYVFELCHIRINKYIKAVFVICNSIIYGTILAIGFYPWFYKRVSAYTENGMLMLSREYTIVHSLLHVLVFIEYFLSILALIYAFVNKKDVSRKSVYLLLFTQSISIIAFFWGRRVLPNIEILPVVYVMDQAVYLIIASRTTLYDVDATVDESVEKQGLIGFASFDFQYTYLGSNEAAKRFLPELSSLYVDASITVNRDMTKIMSWIREFENDHTNTVHTAEDGDKYYKYEVGYLYDGQKSVGYQIMMTDVTQEQKYLSLINDYNSNLKAEVEQKTEHIMMLQDSMVMGMATMVESRDNSTGGHIRRTSDVVKILIKEIMKDSSWGIDEEFKRRMIKAAPMHDLGKIAVDDAILRKPGRFTPEEYEKMKIHAAEGAKVVRKVLADIDDTEFKILAENVAHFHHERWDGSGYPNGLKGEGIPLEARIMAVADVYDALVSKRCYKDSMSFEEAKNIILDGMGKHFDARLKEPFMACVAKLEEYYQMEENRA